MYAKNADAMLRRRQPGMGIMGMCRTVSVPCVLHNPE